MRNKKAEGGEHSAEMGNGKNGIAPRLRFPRLRSGDWNDGK